MHWDGSNCFTDQNTLESIHTCNQRSSRYTFQLVHRGWFHIHSRPTDRDLQRTLLGRGRWQMLFHPGRDPTANKYIIPWLKPFTSGKVHIFALLVKMINLKEGNSGIGYNVLQMKAEGRYILSKNQTIIVMLVHSFGLNCIYFSIITYKWNKYNIIQVRIWRQARIFPGVLGSIKGVKTHLYRFSRMSYFNKTIKL